MKTLLATILLTFSMSQANAGLGCYACSPALGTELSTKLCAGAK